MTGFAHFRIRLLQAFKTISSNWILKAVFTIFVCIIAVSAQAEDKITYRLKWLINMSTVGDLYARDLGYFKAKGMTVNIKPGGPERDAIRELELGYADFGAASADQVIRALDKGAPLVVVAQLFQVNPLQWIYRSSGMKLTSLDALRGKAIGITYGKNDEIIMQTLLSQAGIKHNQVRFFSVRLDYTPFYKGDVELWPVYINTQGVEIAKRLKSAGEQVSFFRPDRFGVRFVANSVVTSRRMATKHPDTVKRFIQALLNGWGDSLDPANAQKALSIIKKYDRDASDDVLKAQLKATRSLIVPGAGKKVGMIDRDAWKQTEKIMLTHGQIKRPVNVTTVLSPVN
ncbi:MAG: ABC transporter substrate-binding protein [Desulfobacteraceae bacterium]|nr:ABC transporter substrate-binding protein [Desulfobacteraceae bacterium]